MLRNIKLSVIFFSLTILIELFFREDKWSHITRNATAVAAMATATSVALSMIVNSKSISPDAAMGVVAWAPAISLYPAQNLKV